MLRLAKASRAYTEAIIRAHTLLEFNNNKKIRSKDTDFYFILFEEQPNKMRTKYNLNISNPNKVCQQI